MPDTRMPEKNGQGRRSRVPVVLGAVVIAIVAVFVVSDSGLFSIDYEAAADPLATSTAPAPKPKPVLDKIAYDAKLLALAHVATSSPWYQYFLTGSINSPQAGTTTVTTTLKKEPWPVKAAYPNPEPVFPFHRVVAYYGNFYSKQMGVLGEYPESQVLQMLASTSASWAAADPSTPVTPAIDYIAITAQASAGQDGMYRARMPASQIDKALAMANQIHGLLILDVQVGKSTLQQELPLLEPYLKLPNVELAIDPEFSMKGAAPPGTVIGTYTSADVNYAIGLLSDLVRQNNLPPKFLIVHRFTEDMVTGYRNIAPTPEVQVVMDMDGWGFPEKKINTYEAVIASEPVQFTGFKLFYKADLKPPSTRLLTPREILNLTPAPSFIQYQ